MQNDEVDDITYKLTIGYFLLLTKYDIIPTEKIRIIHYRRANMTKAEILKAEILKQYKSVRQFAIEMEIPYSTLVTALDRGIEGMAYGTVIRMCDKLNLNPVDFTPLNQKSVLGSKIMENRVMQYYVKLNKTGRKKALELMEDYAQLDKYKAVEES